MQVTVSYVIPQIVEVEITEEMIRELYDGFNNDPSIRNKSSIRNKILDIIDDYLDQESGYTGNDGRDFECDTDIEEWVDEIIDEIEMEGE